jgi:hypothetical protein
MACKFWYRWCQLDRQLLNLCNCWEFDTYFYDNDDATYFYDNDDATYFYDNDDAPCDNSANETDKPLCASFRVIWNGLKC